MTDAELKNLLAERIANVQSHIAAACNRAGRDRREVTLIAVTKTVSSRVAGLLPELGIVDLGESRPQELWRKAEALKHLPIRWHMIGHLQRNKIEQTLQLVELIHSVDSSRLLDAIDADSAKRKRRARVLLQVNISHEEQKHGFEFDEIRGCLNAIANVDVVGLMGMAALNDDPEQARPAFIALRNLRDQLRGELGIQLAHLSMGMSGDYEIAIEEGSTVVRIGTRLFENLE
jgi:PLP dependent protein